MKISIDPVNGNNQMLPSEHLAAVVIGVSEGLKALGLLEAAVTEVEVSFTQGTGLKLKIHYADPLCCESAYTTDYRFIGKGGLYPSAEEIVAVFEEEHGLKKFMRALLEGASGRLRYASKRLDEMLAS
jgi:hypothetical protein